MGILSTSRFHEEVIELPVLPVQDAVVKVLVHWDGIWKMEIQEDQVILVQSVSRGRSS